MSDPDEPITRMMSTDAHEELYRALLDSAEDCPLPVLCDQILALAAVVAKRMHDEYQYHLLTPS